MAKDYTILTIEVKLKNCPFCSQPANLIERSDSDSLKTYFDIGCNTHDCYLEGGADWYSDSREEIINRWNKRYERRDSSK